MKHNLPIKIELPEHFLDEETRCGYTVTKQMKKVWAVQIDLLFEFMRICDKYGLKWFAGGGTLLGAIRHGGYIPWDDDLDIDMLREDYDKFCKVAATEFASPYFYTDGTAEKGTFKAYSQIYNSSTTCIMASSMNTMRSYNQGISIDIFPLDNMPETDEQVPKFLDKIARMHHKCVWLYAHNGFYIPKQGESFKRKLVHFLASKTACVLWPVMNRLWPNRLYRIMKTYNAHKQSSRVSNVALVPYHYGRLFKREWFEKTIQVPFEWFAINAPSGYEQWLSRHYGNWREYVVGTSLHQAGLYDPETPYVNYLPK